MSSEWRKRLKYSYTMIRKIFKIVQINVQLSLWVTMNFWENNNIGDLLWFYSKVIYHRGYAIIHLMEKCRKCREVCKDLYMGFIDLEEAYDRVPMRVFVVDFKIETSSFRVN